MVYTWSCSPYNVRTPKSGAGGILCSSLELWNSIEQEHINNTKLFLNVCVDIPSLKVKMNNMDNPFERV